MFFDVLDTEADTVYIIRLLTYTVYGDGHEMIQDITTASYNPGMKTNPLQEEDQSTRLSQFRQLPEKFIITSCEKNPVQT